MKYRIRIEHLNSGKRWTGEIFEVNEEELKQTDKFLAEVSKGDYSFINMRVGERTVYFGGDILKECVLSLVEVEEDIDMDVI